MKRLLVLLVLGVVFAQLSISSVSLSDQSFSPGSSGYLTITIANIGQSSLSAVSVKAEFPPGVVGGGEQFVGIIESGGSATLSFPFKVEDANKGVSVVRIRVSGSDGSETFIRRSSVALSIVDEPKFSVHLDRSTIESGDSVQIVVKNNGGPAKNVFLSIVNSSVSFAQEDRLFLGDVEGEKAVEATLLASQEGAQKMLLKIEYENEIGESKFYTTAVDLRVKPTLPSISLLQKDPIKTKQTATVRFELDNRGEDKEDVRLIFSNLSVEGGNEVVLGKVPARTKKEFSVKVINPDLPPGTFLMPLKVRWVEKGIEKESLLSVPLEILSDTEVGIFIEGKPTPFMKGERHTLSVLVANKGSYTIDSVSVRVDSEDLELLELSNEQHIGSLEKDDFSTVQFDVMPKKEGATSLQITVNYRDGDGRWKTAKVEKTIVVRPSPTNNFNPLPYLIGAVVGGVAVFLYRRK